MPFKSAAILGLAIPRVCRKKFIVNWREKMVISPRTTCFRDKAASKGGCSGCVIPIS
jgi:hypothetical protein